MVDFHYFFYFTMFTIANVLQLISYCYNLILVQKARHVLQQAYLTPRSDPLWPGAPKMMEFNQRLGRIRDTTRSSDLLTVNYSSHIETLDNFPAQVEAVSVKSFLNAVSLRHQRSFLLKGPDGSGKTVLFRRACSLWAEGLCWRKFKLILWVDMDLLAKVLEPKHEQSLIIFMQYVVPDGVDLEGIYDWVCIHDGQDTIVILDGIDPDTYNKCKLFLDKILSGHWFGKACIITTSTSSLNFLSRVKFSQYDLLGLTHDQVARQVISHYDDRKAEDFFTYISAVPDIKVLCSNPSCLAAVLYVFDNVYPNELPATWTQLFTQLTRLFIRQCPTLDQPAVEQRILQQLAQWVYYGGTISEPLEPFFNVVTPLYRSFRSVRSPKSWGKFSLPWPTYSYLTALHIHTLPLEEQVAMMKSEKFDDRVWQFYAGLCRSMDTLNCLLSNYCGKGIKLVTCTHEAKSVKPFSIDMSQLTFSNMMLTAYQIHVVFSAAWMSSIPCEMNLKSVSFGVGAVAEMGRCLLAASILGTSGIEKLR